MQPRNLTTTVRNCARCGQDHADLRFQLFDRPPSYEWAYWALCPTNGQPVLLRVVEERPTEVKP